MSVSPRSGPENTRLALEREGGGEGGDQTGREGEGRE